MTLLLAAERSAVAAAGHRMLADGLVVGTAGNLSVRVRDRVAVTPSGVPYERLAAAEVGVHDLVGAPVEAALAPTSELPLHLAVYAARPDVRAIVHTHSVAATALSCLADEVPAVHYYAAMFGGAPRVAPYAEYGTPSLAQGAVAALHERSACLLGNHGAVTVGATLDQAYERALYLEWLCDVALRVVGAGVPARLLTADQLTAVAPRLARYGRSPR